MTNPPTAAELPGLERAREIVHETIRAFNDGSLVGSLATLVTDALHNAAIAAARQSEEGQTARDGERKRFEDWYAASSYKNDPPWLCDVAWNCWSAAIRALAIAKSIRTLSPPAKDSPR